MAMGLAIVLGAVGVPLSGVALHFMQPSAELEQMTREFFHTRLFGLPGGTLKPGAAADFALVDLDEPWIVREAEIRSRSKNTCFEDARLQGKVLQCWVAGRKVFGN